MWFGQIAYIYMSHQQAFPLNFHHMKAQKTHNYLLSVFTIPKTQRVPNYQNYAFSFCYLWKPQESPFT